MTIAEVSKMFGLTADTLRYYERIGLIPPVRRSNSGIRDYDETACNWVGFIKCMRRIYYDVVFHGQAGASLRLVAVGNALQRTEEQRMVGYDKVRARFDGFFNNRLGYIQTQ